MTDAGRTLFAAMAPEHAGWIEDIMAGLDRAEAALLWQVLGHLKSSISEAARTAKPRQKARS